MDIQIANLSPRLTESDLLRLFTPFGEIQSVALLRDKWNNRPSGKALVQMPVDREGRQAIISLHGTQLAGRSISVTEQAGE